VLFAVVYMLIAQTGSLRAALPSLQRSSLWLLVLAAGCLVLTWLAAAGMYHALTLRRLQWRKTFIVQIAGSFASRALPAGIGSLGVSYLYLRRQGCSTAIAGAEVALNNVLGFVGHVLLLVVLLTLMPRTKRLVQLHLLWPIVVGSLLIVLLVVFLVLHKFGRRWLGEISALLKHYRRAPGRLGVALLLSLLLTACNIVILWLAARATGAEGSVSLPVAAVALTFGVAAQTATPTPGGLGGVEAGIVAALALWQVPAATALATAFLFRIVTFWLPLLIGSGALLFAARRRYI